MKFISAEKNKLLGELAYCVMAGASAFMLDFSVFYVLTAFFGFYYLISAAIGFACGRAVNYFFSICFIFKTRNVKNQYTEFFAFSLIGIVGLGLNELAIWFFTAGLCQYLCCGYCISVEFWGEKAAAV